MITLFVYYSGNHNDIKWMGIPIFLGLLFIFFYYIPKIFKGQGLITDIHSDLALKKDDEYIKEAKVFACPNCKEKTLVFPNLLHTPQTCGECKKKFIGKPIKSFIYINITAFLIMLPALFLSAFKYVNPWLGLSIMMFSIAMIITTMTITEKRRPVIQEFKRRENEGKWD